MSGEGIYSNDGRKNDQVKNKVGEILLFLLIKVNY